MHILLTGAAGFIGMHTALRLTGRGDTVTGIDNLNDYYDPALKQARLARRQPELPVDDAFLLPAVEVGVEGAVEESADLIAEDGVLFVKDRAGGRGDHRNFLLRARAAAAGGPR